MEHRVMVGAGHRPCATLLLAFVALVLGACARRPINAPLKETDRRAGYRYENRAERENNDPSTVVVLAFSGGGMRAASFSYGVLEELRRTEVTINGRRTRLLDEVDMITGVSGGSFTALAYGLHGEKLFGQYEKRFLKHNVQGELIARLFAPRNWSGLWSEGWGRSEEFARLMMDLEARERSRRGTAN
jgi:NTE family protein